ncbi:hypothetical protein ACN28I_29215 [Archangium gephyra]|uniref:hypothetical protein n=1 Tax=Archangium gephyra TaxID=48 RepID=UPI003B7EE68D
MKRTTVAALLFIAAAAPAAWAGTQEVANVVVLTSMRLAEGSLGSARNSPDSQQMLGCRIVVNSYGAPTGYCAARNASGVSGNCTTTDPEHIAQIRSISDDSFIAFSWNTSGTCTSFHISNFSTFAPKAP